MNIPSTEGPPSHSRSLRGHRVSLAHTGAHQEIISSYLLQFIYHFLGVSVSLLHGNRLGMPRGRERSVDARAFIESHLRICVHSPSYIGHSVLSRSDSYVATYVHVTLCMCNMGGCQRDSLYITSMHEPSVCTNHQYAGC